MTEREIRILNGLDINKIDNNGRYIDVSIPLIFNLKYEQIEYLRERYQTNDIAPNMRSKAVEGQRTREEVPRRESRERCTVSRDQRYNNGRYRTKKTVKYNPIGKIIVGVLVISIAVGSITLLSKKNIRDVRSEELSGIETVEETNGHGYIIENKAFNTPIPVSTIEKTAEEVGETIDEVISESKESEVEEVTTLSETAKMIKELCDIYHVNFDIVYPFLQEKTNNFTNESYLNGIIEGVTCKGESVCASSERELLLYTVRCIKQLPRQLGIKTNNLYTHGGYQSDTNYLNQISKVCADLGLDRCLMYAIVYSECNFNSLMFNNDNNPAGLRIDGEWWHFDTKEEGFYELGMEMLKYYRMIGVSPTEVSNYIIEQIRDIHAPLSDGNDSWLPNVIENYEYAKMNEVTLFNDNMDVELRH